MADDVPEDWQGVVDSVVRVFAVIEGAGEEVMVGVTRVEPGSCKWLSTTGGWCLSIPNLPDLLDEAILEEAGGIYNIDTWDLYISDQQAGRLIAMLKP